MTCGGGSSCARKSASPRARSNLYAKPALRNARSTSSASVSRSSSRRTRKTSRPTWPGNRLSIGFCSPATSLPRSGDRYFFETAAGASGASLCPSRDDTRGESRKGMASIACPAVKSIAKTSNYWPYLDRYAVTSTARGRSVTYASLVGADQPVAHGKTHQPGDVVYVEPLHQLGPVGLHGLDAEVELACDVLGAAAFRDQLENLALARGQQRERLGDLAHPLHVALHHLPRYRRAQVGFTAGD